MVSDYQKLYRGRNIVEDNIIIVKEDNGFYFPYNKLCQSILREKIDRFCKGCGCILNYIYIYIIEELYNKKFLPKDYKMFCCSCWSKEKHVG